MYSATSFACCLIGLTNDNWLLKKLFWPIYYFPVANCLIDCTIVLLLLLLFVVVVVGGDVVCDVVHI